ncbi:MAG: YdcF family protein [Defluviitaleaceae bacterium]|nr:YdcF family protein [Defluviitaleaceae bacterium]
MKRLANIAASLFGKAVGVIFFLRLLIIPSTSSMTVGVVSQTVLFSSLGIYAAFYKKFPRKLRTIINAGFLTLLIFAGFLAIYGNVGTATFEENAVIVLGAGVSGERVSTPLARRLDVALYYFERNPDAYIVVCGGLGERATITEAEAMARYLYARGVPREKILLEDRSVSTIENLTFARDILEEHFSEGFGVVVVSNDFHMFRAVSMARRVGMDANHLGAPTPTRLLTENYLREMMAIVLFWVSNPA